MSNWFQSQFCPPKTQGINNKDIVKGPLTFPITAHETEIALHRLNNNRACGPDQVAGELWKYSAGIISTLLANIFNDALQEGHTLDLGQGTLIPLQKPGKPSGPLTNIHPIVFLTTIQKLYH